jgi:hypothetical protein
VKSDEGRMNSDEGRVKSGERMMMLFIFQSPLPLRQGGRGHCYELLSVDLGTEDTKESHR